MLLNRSLIPIRVGSLFVAAGLVNPQALSEALAASRQEKILIGQVLIDRGHVQQDELKAALDLQQLIRDGNISLELAGRALKKVRCDQAPVHRALSESGWRHATTHDGCALTRLLQRSELVTKQQLEQAKVTSQQTGLPVGRSLVLTGALTPSLLNAVLSAMVLIRDGHLNENRAANVLRICHKNKQPLEELIESSPAQNSRRIRIGDLLCMSGILSDSDASIALEIALTKERLTGDVLVEQGYVTRQVIDAAIKIQQLVDGEALSGQQGPEIVRQVHVTGVPVDQFIAMMFRVREGAVRLLLESQVLTSRDLDQAAASFTGEQDRLRLAQVAGLIDIDVFRQAIRLSALVADGEVSADAACHQLALSVPVAQSVPLTEEPAGGEWIMDDPVEADAGYIWTVDTLVDQPVIERPVVGEIVETEAMLLEAPAIEAIQEEFAGGSVIDEVAEHTDESIVEEVTEHTDVSVVEEVIAISEAAEPEEVITEPETIVEDVIAQFEPSEELSLEPSEYEQSADLEAPEDETAGNAGNAGQVSDPYIEWAVA